jgi:hypothetical protein
MRFIKKVTQRLLDSRGRLGREDGLINTTDLLVATAATVVLAAGVGGTVLSTLDESKYGKAQPDAQAIGQAIVEFYTDTGKWPGQSNHTDGDQGVVLLATGPVGSAVTPGSGSDPETVTGFILPAIENGGLNHAEQSQCEANSGQGFVNGSVDAITFDGTITGATVLNLNDFLVRRPPADYPNWDGPYVQDISTDPWDRSWIAYLAPLYCAEPVVTSAGAAIANGAGNLGYAWLISGGTNRTITTPATSPVLDPLGDDTGVNLGKLASQTTGTAAP